MIELLSPAGSADALDAALRFGADAVYGGLNAYGLRAGAKNFTPDQLSKAVEKAHAANAKFYLTLNILPYDDELDGLVSTAKMALEIGADAAIVSDIGAICRLRRDVPALPLHVSTQANVMNAPFARLLHDMGAKRVVLARELSLERIKTLRESLPAALELEAFVHGAMCMAYSGRCILSDHMTGRNGNRGECAQPCRWHYQVVEEKRPGEVIDVSVDDRGTSLFSAYDLCMLEYLPEMARAGIVSLKIEGRMKTAYYVASVTACYRRALDILQTKGEAAYRAALPALVESLQKASHRASNTGFYFGAPRPAAGAGGFTQTMEYVADVIGWADGEAKIRLKNRFYVGDVLEALTPHGERAFPVLSIRDAETGEFVSTLSVAGREYLIPCPVPVSTGDFLRGPNRNHQ